jgi:hypothetical protein
VTLGFPVPTIVFRANKGRSCLELEVTRIGIKGTRGTGAVVHARSETACKKYLGDTNNYYCCRFL